MIPKNIHYCWFGGNPLPKEYENYIESWKYFCPDYEIIRWDESNYDVIKNKYMNEAYKAGKWCFVSDYARLDIIYEHGGIYLDTDVEIIKSFDDLLVNKAFMGFESKNKVASGLGFGAVKNHETIRLLRDFYNDLNFINTDGSFNTTPSPDYQTRCLLKIGLKRNNKKQSFAGITVYPIEYFAPKCFVTERLKITKNTYGIHHYSASWFDEVMCSKMEYQVKLSKYFGGLLSQLIAALKFYGFKKTMKRICCKLFRRM